MGPDSGESAQWFGSPHVIETGAEKHSSRSHPDEMRAMFDGYRALDTRSTGRYRAFLTQASRCNRCSLDSRIPTTRQPIPLLCGQLADSEIVEAAHTALDRYRREQREHGSLRVNPNDGVTALAAFLDEHQLSGLSIGHCGWGDLTARLRGQQLAEGIDVMILGADWYPLTACSNFLLDRYHEGDHTLGTFHRHLRKVDPEIPEDLGTLFRRYRFYLGNTLLCYRTGWAKQGLSNLSRHSFENCREHLRRHIDALEPRIIVTFGREPARSLAHLVEGTTAGANETLKALRANPALKKIMERYVRDTGVPGIAATLHGRELALVPLYHPSMPNRYEDDYRALVALLQNLGERAYDSQGTARAPEFLSRSAK